MKKKNLKTILLLLCFLTAGNLFSQDNCTDIAGPIDQGEVRLRIGLFNEKTVFLKNKKISTLPLEIVKSDMIMMLQQFKNLDARDEYDGLRVYYICPKKETGDSNMISLLFVPTLRTGETEDCSAARLYRSQNDSANAFYFTGSALKRIDLRSSNTSAENISMLNWQLGYQSVATTIPRGIRRVFEESKSTWYAKEVFFKKLALKDMLTFLQNCEIVSGVKIYFASFRSVTTSICGGFLYKTHPIFEMTGTGLIANFFTLATAEIKKNNDRLKKLHKSLFLAPVYSDTGLPCPPNKCN
jgi:hypothetical protein